jgi:hypothetical protein
MRVDRITVRLRGRPDPEAVARALDRQLAPLGSAAQPVSQRVAAAVTDARAGKDRR